MFYESGAILADLRRPGKDDIVLSMVIIQVQKLRPHAQLPSYAHPGDAGMDVYAAEETTIKKGQRGSVPTGIAAALPEGYVALVWDKSGIAFKTGVTTIGGVIDAGYRGEYMIGVINLGEADYTFKQGDKMAQILIQPIARATITEVTQLEESSRGTGGFGSTGA